MRHVQQTADIMWYELIDELVFEPDCVSSPRGREVHELFAHQTIVNMQFPIVRSPARKLGYRFMAAEAYWILTGDNRLETIKEYAPGIEEFSNDGYRFDGAYGPRVVDQLRYVVDAIHKDNETRQAIIDIWRPNPRDSRDIPCTLSLQFLPRFGHINTVATMRSSDAWLGWPYDVFNFTMITSYIILMLYQRYTEQWKLGFLHLTAGSQHLYSSNIVEAKHVLREGREAKVPDQGAWDPLLLVSPDNLFTLLAAFRKENAGIHKCPLFNALT